jgi:FKBP-type peptidyl-prolyl cis-trans isomerase FkpA
MSKNLLAISLFFLIIGSLQAQGIPTEHGYRFVNHTNGIGMRTQRGESALFRVNVWAGQQLLNTSSKLPGGIYRFDLMSPGTESDHYPPMFDAALLMVKGDSATVYQPIDSFMRTFLPPAAQQEKDIRFELFLSDIVSIEAKNKALEQAKAYAKTIQTKVQAKAQAYRTGLMDLQIKTLPSGLKIYVEEVGRGAKIKHGEAVQVHYFGVLTNNGNPFDNSYERREPLGFAAGAGQMISGFDEGIMQLNHGAKAYLFIPWNLAYGEGEAAGGSIPPKSDLTFYIDVQ